MNDIDVLINSGQYADALKTLNAAIESRLSGDDRALAHLYFQRGKLYWRMGKQREAVNDYTMAESLDPASPASVALTHAREIISFHAPDLYNP